MKNRKRVAAICMVAVGVMLAGCFGNQQSTLVAGTDDEGRPILVERAGIDVGGDLVTSTGEQNFRDGDEIDQSRIITGDKATILTPDREPMEPLNPNSDSAHATEQERVASAPSRRASSVTEVGDGGDGATCLTKETVPITVFKPDGTTEVITSTSTTPC